jgi:putative transposase
VLLGEEGFIDKYKDLLSDKEQVKEIPRSQRYVSRPSLSKLLAKQDSASRRNKRMHSAKVKYGYTLKEIADHLGIHYTTVSKAVDTHGLTPVALFKNLTSTALCRSSIETRHSA